MARIKEIAGPVQLMEEGVVYALPGQITVLYADNPNAPIEYSEDAIAFTQLVLFNSQATTSAPYIRAVVRDVLINFK